jgi:hypothetical protein
MASKGNTLESWEPSPWTPAPNANVADQKAMTSAQAQAARAKSAEVMAALKKGEPGDADRLLVSFIFAGRNDGWAMDHEEMSCETSWELELIIGVLTFLGP